MSYVPYARESDVDPQAAFLIVNVIDVTPPVEFEFLHYHLRGNEESQLTRVDVNVLVPAVDPGYDNSNYYELNLYYGPATDPVHTLLATCPLNPAHENPDADPGRYYTFTFNNAIAVGDLHITYKSVGTPTVSPEGLNINMYWNRVN